MPVQAATRLLFLPFQIHIIVVDALIGPANICNTTLPAPRPISKSCATTFNPVASGYGKNLAPLVPFQALPDLSSVHLLVTLSICKNVGRRRPIRNRSSGQRLKRPVAHHRLYHCLVVENDQSDAMLIKRALLKSDLPVTVFVCRSATEAKAYLNTAGIYADERQFPKPRALIVDLHLGAENGNELLIWVRSQPAFSNLASIIITGSLNPSELNPLRKLGVHQIVNKSSTMDDLVRAVFCLTQG
jgi:CheY-like chemotaxis protein